MSDPHTPPPMPFLHKLGHAVTLTLVVLALFIGAHLGGRWIRSTAPQIPHILGYAPPPPAGPGYINPTGNTTTSFGVMHARCVGGEPIYDYKCVDAGAGVLVATFPGFIANGEADAVDMTAQIFPVNGSAASGFGNCTRRFHGEDINGVFQTAAGATTDTAITTDFGGTLTDAGCQIVYDAGASGQLMTRGLAVSTGAGACVYYGVSNQRCLPTSWANLSIDQVVPNAITTVVASPTVIQVFGTHDIQPATATSFVLSNNTNSFTLSNPGACGGNSSNCAQATVLPATYVSGTYNLALTTAAGTFTLTNVFTFGVNGTLTGISPPEGVQEGGDTITLTGTNMSGVTSVALGGSVATCSGCTSTTCSCVTTAGPSTDGGPVNAVLSPGGSTLTNGYTYYHSGIVAAFDSELGVTTSSGTVTTWADAITTSGLTFTCTSTHPTYSSGCGGGRHCLTAAGASSCNTANTTVSGTNSVLYVVGSITTSANSIMFGSTNTIGSGTLSNGFLLYGSGTNTFVGYEQATGIGDVNSTGSGTVTQNVTSLYTATFNHTAGATVQGVFLFFNGASTGSATSTQAVANNWDTGGFYIFQNAAGSPMTGTIAKVVVGKNIPTSTGRHNMCVLFATEYGISTSGC